MVDVLKLCMDTHADPSTTMTIADAFFCFLSKETDAIIHFLSTLQTVPRKRDPRNAAVLVMG